jgi:NAD(P)-dependent dehydrogenase (short-subunit alcohol dehydrogenase family)
VLLTERLRGALALRRIVNVSSAAHFSAELDFTDLECGRHQWDGADAYSRSKLALTTYTCALGARDVDAVSLHPGIVDTDLLHAMFPISGVSPESAASHILEVAGRRGDAGSYYDERRPVAPHPAATDAATQRRLADVTGEWLRPFLR